FSGTLLKAAGTLTLEIDQDGQAFVYIAGSIAFERGEPQTVTTENGKTGQASILEIGAAGVTIFFGTGAVVDTVQHTIDTSSAAGLRVSNAGFGLALMTPSAALATASGAASFFALKAGGNVSLVGIDGFQASIQNVSIEINKARSAAGADVEAAVDFVTSFPASGPNPAGLAIPTGPTSSIDLAFTASILEAPRSPTPTTRHFPSP